MPTQHKAGWQKQSNKGHKQRHRSKGDVAKALGGKVNRRAMSVTSASVNGSISSLGKTARANRAATLRKNKRDAMLMARRGGGSSASGALGGAPRTVGIVFLSDKARVPAFLGQKGLEAHPGTDNFTVVFPKEKFRTTFIVAERSSIGVLDVAKVADILCFVLPLTIPEHGTEIGSVKKGGALESYLGDSIDALGRQFITLCKSQGMPAVVGIAQNLDMVPGTNNSAVKKNVVNFFREEFDENTKVIFDESQSKASSKMSDSTNADVFGNGLRENMSANQFQFIRSLMETPLKNISWRSERSYMVSLDATVQSNSDDPSKATLAISGFLRGRPLEVNQVVHIPDHGNFFISRITKPQDPFPIRRHKKSSTSTSSSSPLVLAEADPSKRPSLVEEANPDLLSGDQTWPTEEEMVSKIQNQVKAERKAKAELRKKMKNLPPGTSDYQAAWLLGISDDEEEEEDAIEEGDEEEEEDDLMKPRELSGKVSSKMEEEEEGDDLGVDDEEPGGMTLAEWKKKQSDERDELEFPDEVETPQDISAKERFAKYRGLKSFRTSPWHPKESLPREYARIFQLQNPVGTQNQVLEEGQAVEEQWLQSIASEQRALKKNKNSDAKSVVTMDMDAEMNAIDEGDIERFVYTNPENGKTYVYPGQFVTVYIEEVPSNILETVRMAKLPLMFGALLDHETKLSVLNASVVKVNSYEGPVKARDEIVMSCGIWRRTVRPTFSENAINCDKHKFERFLHAGRWSVATAYAPVTFGTNIPVLFLNPATKELIANGSLLSVDPDRIVLKKVVLSGYPIRVKKTWAVVRYMFFRPEDIRWFKPIDLWTKYGMSGRILEPLGTHGLFKCTFNKPIKNHDTVCMSLYKRVYPKPVSEFAELQREQVEEKEVAMET